MEKWQSGNKRDFEQVYNRYNTMVSKHAYLITGSRDIAEDIVQEVFLAAWKFGQATIVVSSLASGCTHYVNECYKKIRAILFTTV
jgi:DNA-directed RNA polymerase specialized sigma24 family protein